MSGGRAICRSGAGCGRCIQCRMHQSVTSSGGGLGPRSSPSGRPASGTGLAKNLNDRLHKRRGTGYNPPAPRLWSENPRSRTFGPTSRQVHRRAPMEWIAVSVMAALIVSWLIVFCIDPEAFNSGSRR